MDLVRALVQQKLSCEVFRRLHEQVNLLHPGRVIPAGFDLGLMIRRQRCVKPIPVSKDGDFESPLWGAPSEEFCRLCVKLLNQLGRLINIKRFDI